MDLGEISTERYRKSRACVGQLGACGWGEEERGKLRGCCVMEAEGRDCDTR